jgi:hypothetical protein
MAVRSCRVTVQDSEGISHTVDVTAATLYEAVAQGLAAFRCDDWVADLGGRIGVVKVSVAEIRVEHEVKLKDFTSWLERPGRSPREIIERQKIRGILGMPAMR